MIQARPRPLALALVLVTLVVAAGPAPAQDPRLAEARREVKKKFVDLFGA